MDQIPSNQYDAELEALYTAITGRPSFRYDAAADPLYRSYADRYVQNGRMAMRDTQGHAAALTGGYGSSYAQTAGQQQYDEYLRSLSEVLPELYGLAYQQYSDQGAALQNAYDLRWQQRSDAYQRGRDALADQRYEDEQRSAAAQTAYKQQTDSYNRLYKLIATAGYSPSDAELQTAGLSRAQANALRQEYLRAKGLLPAAESPAVSYVSAPAASSSGSGGSASGSGGSAKSLSGGGRVNKNQGSTTKVNKFGS